MSDEADRAAAHNETLLSHYIASIRARAEKLGARGACLNCEEPCRGVFCCSECGQDHEARERAQRRSGA